MSENNCSTAMENDSEVMAFLTAKRILDGKWTIPILYHLEKSGPLRFNELMRKMGVAQGTLSKQLKSLEKDGLVKRKVFAEVPLHVEYSLTPIACKFKPVLEAFEKWGREYMNEMEKQEESAK